MPLIQAPPVEPMVERKEVESEHTRTNYRR